MDLKEKLIDVQTVYEGSFFDIKVDTVKLPNGQKATRDILVHNGASTVLPIDKDGNIILVRQYRDAIKETILETPAGKLKLGEDPKQAAKRELEEEIGYKAGKIEEYGNFYPAVGYSSEKIYIYKASELTLSKQNLDDDEFVNVERFSPKLLKEMILKGEIEDSKTAFIILKYCMENNI